MSDAPHTPTRRALLGRLAAAGVAAPALNLVAPDRQPELQGDRAEAQPAPSAAARSPRVRPGHPVTLDLRDATAVRVEVGPEVVGGAAPRRYPVTAGACRFNAPVLLAEGDWVRLICTPERGEGDAAQVGSPVVVWVRALPRHFGG